MSAFCPECTNGQHFQCSRPCYCKCTIEDRIEHTKHSNIVVNTADVRHANHYTEAEVRQSNRELRDQLVDRRKYTDESEGVAPWHYRFRKGLGKAFVGASVINTIRSWEQLP